MKIAVVGPAYPFRGGIAHYTTLLAAQLAREHDTRLYSFQRLYPAWLYPGRSQIDPSERPLAEVEVRRWLTPWWPWSWRRVTTDWSRWHPDRLVVQWWVPFMAPLTRWLLDHARQLGVHTTVICHNVLPHEQSRSDRALARLALGRADQLIVHSAAQQALAHELLPQSSVTVVAHPTYASFQAHAWPQASARQQLQLAGRVALFFGLVRPYKGLLDLIEALPQVLSEIEVTLLVVGEIWGDATVYRERVQALGLTERVRFIDRYVSNDEAAMCFAAADLAVLPYRAATGSGVLQLAFGLGVPVVATRTGGMGEAVQDGVTGLLVEPGNVAELAGALARFFREDCGPSFRAAIARAQTDFGWHDLTAVITAES
jgi:glycosyltransferase involved in cell wall biosynthesis